jgi:photosynthetic reaction center H subunit
MSPAFTHQLDAVQLLVAGFFLFFAGLVYYLRREDKREGYPLLDITPTRGVIEGFPPMPPPKIYSLLEGGTTQMPHEFPETIVSAQRLQRFPGAPLVPVGDPMRAELGPGTYPQRKDEPMMSGGEPQTQPLRAATDWKVSRRDPDPRGMRVFDGRSVAVGTVCDLWVDRGVKILRYLEVELDPVPFGGRHVLVPIYYTAINGKHRSVRVRALLATHFADIPATAHPDEITAREEDRISAYVASGLMFSRGMTGGIVSREPNSAGAVS